MRNHIHIWFAHSPLLSGLLHVRKPSRGWEICGYFAVQAWEGLSRGFVRRSTKRAAFPAHTGVPNAYVHGSCEDSRGDSL
jgi:hypothetical protein